jgi:type II secretory pathway component PulC
METEQTLMTRVLFFCALTLLSGCVARDSTGPVLLSSVRQPSALRTEDVITLPRSQVVEVLDSKRSINFIRLVQIFARHPEPSRVLPQYRMFNIRPGSIGDLLGFQNGDILVAANDYVVFDPNKFQQYLELFRIEKDPFIEIIRDGRPIVYRYKLTEG